MHYYTKQLYQQLAITPEILDGSANDTTMNNLRNFNEASNHLTTINDDANAPFNKILKCTN